MNAWMLCYRGREPGQEGLREVLCALGNGYIVTRSALANAVADDVHYPGTYLAGGYDRLVTDMQGHEIENEDLVNLPNWLPLVFKIDGGSWLRPDTVDYLDYSQDLKLDEGVLVRTQRFRDGEGRIMRWEERRIVSMHDAHLAAMSVTLTPENWSGRVTIRSSIDGGVVNWGVKRYRALEGRHLETLDTDCDAGNVLSLRSRFVQARREVALAARTRVEMDGTGIAPIRQEALGEGAETEFEVDLTEGRGVHVEKVASYYNSEDHGIAEPLHEARRAVRRAAAYPELERRHRLAWKHIWEQCDILVASTANHGAQLRLRLHIFHLMQTASFHSVESDVGIPPRGWHGEAYRGHIMWDELFIFPYLNLRMPVITRGLLRYRYRRLDEARRAAREAGHQGAMFPWMSGSDGREETQKIHLNPVSGRWIPDNSWRQRHIGAAVCFNLWQYYEATYDRHFLQDFGAEMFLEIARFWSGLAEKRPDGRYGIRGVMGPDEFHTAYPGADPSTEGGLDNNAYTNVMVSWLFARAIDILDILPNDERRRLCERIELTEQEIERFDTLSRKLVIPFHDGNIISQFEGYGDLKEFDWEAARKEFGDIQRLDRILEAAGQDPNDYKVSKQADVLMLFYLFSADEIILILDRLGYHFTEPDIAANVDYYLARTSHGSTLSFITHAWVLARTDRTRSWELALEALESDIGDVQGGTTAEGIHLGAMAGTVDLFQRCYLGVELRSGTLMFDPRLPEEVNRLDANVRYRGQLLDLSVTQERLTISSRPMTAHPVTVAYRGHVRELSPGQTFSFRLVREADHLDSADGTGQTGAAGSSDAATRHTEPA